MTRNFEKKDRILLNRLRIAAEIWSHIENTPVPADRWMGNYFHQHRKRIGSRDRKFFAETIYSLFRHKSFYAALLTIFRKTSPVYLPLMASLKEGLIEPDDALAVLRETSPLSVPPEHWLRMIQTHTLPDSVDFQTPVKKLSVHFSCPEWLIERWETQWGEKKTLSLLESLLRKAPLTVRANSLKIDRSILVERFQAMGFSVKNSRFSPNAIIFEEKRNVFDTEEFREGLFEVQDEGSQLLCEMIRPLPGENVWDVCAGGGGKSLYLAALMQNKGRLVATDIRSFKLEELKKRAKRSGVFNIFPADINRMRELKTAQKGFDKILVDAPCSGTGTLRRNPDAKWKLKPDDFKNFHAAQVEIIRKALPYLKENGILYYATCSLDREENEDVLEEILAAEKTFKQVRLPETKDGCLRLHPDAGSSDGFFMAAFQKSKT